MGLFDSIGRGIKGHFQKKSEYQDAIDQMQRDSDLQKLQAFKDQFKIDAKEVAIAQAKKDSANLSGLAKLRATNRARNLNNQGPIPGSFFDKLGEFTKKNKARMHENLERTKEMRAVAESEKVKKLQIMSANRESPRRKAFGETTWRM